ncbi:secretory carrier-associated membrane protein 1-like isoform X2 [Apostichopus japonicus]|uniref:secretory carrier-associated membrane protein 1-like isoform X2 n=1 Tax=Stichopus japonicus TaxID=307972 RepID=UPI003AB2268E
MSDFDSNPFADPTTTSPFQDPSVQQATANSSRGLEEFNPFEDSNKQTNTSVPSPVPAQSTQPAVVNTSRDAPPAYSASAAQAAATSAANEDLLRRQAELEEKAAELQRREQQLRNAQYNIRENNFPPLPKWFPVGPCFYQDFAVDIPVSFQKIVKIGFYLWLGYSILLFINIFVALGYFAADKRKDSPSGSTFVVSILYFAVMPAASYLCWFRPVYKAFRSDSSFNFFLFFFIFFFQCIVTGILTLGLENLGACGLINSIAFLASSTSPSVGKIVVGLLMLVVALCFAALAIASVCYLYQVHSLYRSTGASFEKAQAEFAKSVASNPGVQSATKQAASAAVSGAMSANQM